MKIIEKIQFITHSASEQDIYKQTNAMIENGIKWIQFRMKDTSFEKKLPIARNLKEICSKNNVKLIINDDVEIARIIKADGIHLGLEDCNPIDARRILGEDTIIGGTCNTYEQIIRRNEQGVDYIGLGPYKFTSTKKNLSPIISLSGYKNILKQMKENNINIPIIGIGGIEINDISQIINTGVYGIALSSLLIRSNNLHKDIEKINNAINH
ncbi:MAG: thiamine phosphate synthase [Marinifilaceae bacterium]|jgi:thiamine-phosphate pyrophosphorylase|nr:thiamine phosphate synthase [Marinifilaceae bacterium]